MANNLRCIREAAARSLAEVARQLGVSRITVYRWERAKTSPSLARLEQLAALYAVPIEDLVRTDYVACCPPHGGKHRQENPRHTGRGGRR